ncbi:hypothetical protein [Rathayibacter iranicus]|uniref:Uncharacterized protein n=2 Tax=Rathayibacter iranicus TaxID=59737 RepID=A0AAD1AF00_9MICO|nr:hypothetical protein [Rathayibacter iranicus]AZZ55915.1 hypothetical protein C7V51_08555 [Rathayibacter iranicus]MWV30637.1 hypothetical protein [Rathayibacter iranicus NCPPB 2253 = VKM Ac-1602]PPI47239.1 hypothetical protein C5E09_07590 [Rathayibacter iranicus]PPI60282.1 hypothetical protein C5E08_08520 [Rathayibacter iranicus]PPI71746.1 hypothetical protein C5E01_07555 [Rathayibacter iranicus]
MSPTEFSNAIQVTAVLAAVVASIIALVVSALDRRNARSIADADRAAAARQARLQVELTAATRLLENQVRGGSTDPHERKRMGAEALTLIGLLGKERLPELWADHVKRDDEGLRKLKEDPGTEMWQTYAIEVQLAMNAILRDMDESAVPPLSRRA